MYKLIKDEDGAFTTKLDCPVCENKYVFVEGENGYIDNDISSNDMKIIIAAKCTECGHKEKFEGKIED